MDHSSPQAYNSKVANVHKKRDFQTRNALQHNSHICGVLKEYIIIHVGDMPHTKVIQAI